MREGLSFGEIFSDEAVHVLVSPALLRTVSVGEIHFAFQEFFHRLVVPKLDPIVERNGVYRKATQSYFDDPCDRPGPQGSELPDNDEP